MSRKRTGYVVMESGWEYNDEIYTRPESDGGRPRGVFFSRAKAQKEAERLSGLAIGGICLGDYTYGELHNIVDTSRALDLVEALGLDKHKTNESDDIDAESILEDWWENTNRQISSTISVSQSQEIARCLELEFFTIQEVEVEIED